MAGQEGIIAVLGVIVIAGVIGRLFLKKTGVSDVFLLLVFGAAAGVLIPAEMVDGMRVLLLPLGAVALLMIILDEGLRLSYDSLRRSAHKAMLFGALSFGLSFIAAFALSYFGAGYPLLLSLLVASIFAGVAPELLSGFLRALDASESARDVGEIEATLSDALSVMAALLFVSAAGSGALDLSLVPLELALILLLSAAAGTLMAAFWKGAVARIAEGNEHLAAIGLAALLYAISGLLGANGVISVFVFAFFVGNSTHKAVQEMKDFQSEITFFLRTFFFIYLGVLLFHSPKPVEVAIFASALAVLLAGARMLAGKVIQHIDSSTLKGRLLETVSSRGLTSAVLAIVVYEELGRAGGESAIDLPLLALFVIFISNAISAWLVLRKKGAQ